MKIKKMYQGTAPENKILNTNSDSQTDVYSCDYVNKLNTYSTEETIIGTWLGKPLYRKVLEFTDTITENLTKVHGIVNAERVWCSLGDSYFLATTNNMSIPLPVVMYYHDTNDKVAIQVDLNNVYIFCDGTWDTNWTKVITLHYTKTTD